MMPVLMPSQSRNQYGVPYSNTSQPTQSNTHFSESVRSAEPMVSVLPNDSFFNTESVNIDMSDQPQMTYDFNFKKHKKNIEKILTDLNNFKVYASLSQETSQAIFDRKEKYGDLLKKNLNALNNWFSNNNIIDIPYAQKNITSLPQNLTSAMRGICIALVGIINCYEDAGKPASLAPYNYSALLGANGFGALYTISMFGFTKFCAAQTEFKDTLLKSREMNTACTDKDNPNTIEYDVLAPLAATACSLAVMAGIGSLYRYSKLSQWEAKQQRLLSAHREFLTLCALQKDPQNNRNRVLMNSLASNESSSSPISIRTTHYFSNLSSQSSASNSAPLQAHSSIQMVRAADPSSLTFSTRLMVKNTAENAENRRLFLYKEGQSAKQKNKIGTVCSDPNFFENAPDSVLRKRRTHLHAELHFSEKISAQQAAEEERKRKRSISEPPDFRSFNEPISLLQLAKHKDENTPHSFEMASSPKSTD